MEALKCIGLYGGTFDPVHLGHLAVAENLLRLFALDGILFIPAYVAPHKRNAPVTPALHRYAMLALATQHEDRFRVSSIELEEPERPYSIETLARLQVVFSGTARLFFIMGADSWEEITTWRDWERVLTMTDHIVVTRPGYELSIAHVASSVREGIVDVRGVEREAVRRIVSERGATKIYLADAVMTDISSTAIRHAARRQNSEVDLTALVPPPVADYIKKYGLYRELNGSEFFDAETGFNKHRK